MTKTTLRLAAGAATTAVGMLLVPSAASAESTSPPMMAKMRGHATMADALQAHPELAEMNPRSSSLPKHIVRSWR